MVQVNNIISGSDLKYNVPVRLHNLSVASFFGYTPFKISECRLAMLHAQNQCIILTTTLYMYEVHNVLLYEGSK